MASDVATLSNPVFLEKIDKLRDLNIGQHVSLPQLVVVGDQSSGKSSLLESVTGIPFPKDQTLCTRHATQITSRRGNESCVRVTIHAGPNATEEHRKRLETFDMKLGSSEEFRKQFVDILKKANDTMGLRLDVASGRGDVFSRDVLKIEVSGPDEDYLTVIDVPGIFRTTMEGTTTSDMRMVKDLVESYIREDRTIILAVLPANVDIATQEILQLAEKYDPAGKRTIGVLTKPDLVTEPSAQAKVCDLVSGKRRPLHHGYYLVQNRGPEDHTSDSQALSKLFQSEPWVKLPQERLGIPALKDQLSTLLIELSTREFPNMIREIKGEIQQCNKDLETLGPPREKSHEQRNYLHRIADSFQERVRAALIADYNASPDFHDDVQLRLITHIANITDVFRADFQERAHTRHFEQEQRLPTPETSVVASPADVLEPYDSDSGIPEDRVESVEYKLRLLVKDLGLDLKGSTEDVELGDIFGPSKKKVPKPRGSVDEWIGQAYLHSRGLELGTFNSNFISEAFVEQSRNWELLTQEYMRRVIIIVHRFIAAALRSVWSDEAGREQLWEAILDSLIERYKSAQDQASLLIKVDQQKQPYTLNPQFSKIYSQTRGQRIAALLRPKAHRDKVQYGTSQYFVNWDDIAQAAEEKSNIEDAKERIHDILKAYYSLALDRFLDNVFQLAVDHLLLRGPSGPLQVFTQDWVLNLPSEKLKRIVGESKATKRSRQRLTQTKENLTKALRVLNEPWE
ncbi:dynamin family protein [Sarocladium implicatum]|nr:dynamin family protein [Sarocladium implicatum]